MRALSRALSSRLSSCTAWRWAISLRRESCSRAFVPSSATSASVAARFSRSLFASSVSTSWVWASRASSWSRASTRSSASPPPSRRVASSSASSSARSSASASRAARSSWLRRVSNIWICSWASAAMSSSSCRWACSIFSSSASCWTPSPKVASCASSSRATRSSRSWRRAWSSQTWSESSVTASSRACTVASFALHASRISPTAASTCVSPMRMGSVERAPRVSPPGGAALADGSTPPFAAGTHLGHGGRRPGRPGVGLLPHGREAAGRRAGVAEAEVPEQRLERVQDRRHVLADGEALVEALVGDLDGADVLVAVDVLVDPLVEVVGDADGGEGREGGVALHRRGERLRGRVGRVLGVRGRLRRGRRADEVRGGARGRPDLPGLQLVVVDLAPRGEGRLRLGQGRRRELRRESGKGRRASTVSPREGRRRVDSTRWRTRSGLERPPPAAPGPAAPRSAPGSWRRGPRAPGGAAAGPRGPRGPARPWARPQRKTRRRRAWRRWPRAPPERGRPGGPTGLLAGVSRRVGWAAAMMKWRGSRGASASASASVSPHGGLLRSGRASGPARERQRERETLRGRPGPEPGRSGPGNRPHAPSAAAFTTTSTTGAGAGASARPPGSQRPRLRAAAAGPPPRRRCTRAAARATAAARSPRASPAPAPRPGATTSTTRVAIPSRESSRFFLLCWCVLDRDTGAHDRSRGAGTGRGPRLDPGGGGGSPPTPAPAASSVLRAGGFETSTGAVV